MQIQHFFIFTNILAAGALIASIANGGSPTGTLFAFALIWVYPVALAAAVVRSPMGMRRQLQLLILALSLLLIAEYAGIRLGRGVYRENAILWFIGLMQFAALAPFLLVPRDQQRLLLALTIPTVLLYGIACRLFATALTDAFPGASAVILTPLLFMLIATFSTLFRTRFSWQAALLLSVFLVIPAYLLTPLFFIR